MTRRVDLDATCASHGLFVMGVLADGDATLTLIGADNTFWTHFTQSQEYRDAVANPIDSYSKRVIAQIAAGREVLFPSDGPPYAPFIGWALKTGRFWQSPTGMMVHDTAGLMVSIRGAIRNISSVTTTAQASPCDNCATKPCVSACPVGALNGDTFYDVPECKAYLDTPAGGACMSKGCEARRACPVSQRFNRPDAQSAFHMKAFHP